MAVACHDGRLAYQTGVVVGHPPTLSQFEGAKNPKSTSGEAERRRRRKQQEGWAGSTDIYARTHARMAAWLCTEWGSGGRGSREDRGGLSGGKKQTRKNKEFRRPDCKQDHYNHDNLHTD